MTHCVYLLSSFDHSPVSMARPARWLGGNLARAVAVAPTIEVFMTPAGLTGCFLAIALFCTEKENDV